MARTARSTTSLSLDPLLDDRDNHPFIPTQSGNAIIGHPQNDVVILTMLVDCNETDGGDSAFWKCHFKDCCVLRAVKVESFHFKAGL